MLLFCITNIQYASASIPTEAPTTLVPTDTPTTPVPTEAPTTPAPTEPIIPSPTPTLDFNSSTIAPPTEAPTTAPTEAPTITVGNDCTIDAALNDCLTHCGSYSGTPSELCNDLDCLIYCTQKQRCITPVLIEECTAVKDALGCGTDCSSANSIMAGKASYLGGMAAIAVTLKIMLF